MLPPRELVHNISGSEILKAVCSIIAAEEVTPNLTSVKPHAGATELGSPGPGVHKASVRPLAASAGAKGSASKFTHEACLGGCS